MVNPRQQIQTMKPIIRAVILQTSSALEFILELCSEASSYKGCRDGQVDLFFPLASSSPEHHSRIALSTQKLPCLPHLPNQIPYMLHICGGYPVSPAPSLNGRSFSQCVFLIPWPKKHWIKKWSRVLWFIYVFHSMMFAYVMVMVGIINVTGSSVLSKMWLWACPWGIILIVLIKVEWDAHWGWWHCFPGWGPGLYKWRRSTGQLDVFIHSDS